MATTNKFGKDLIDTSSMKFEVPLSVKPVRDAVLEFMEEFVYPYEQRHRLEGTLKDLYDAAEDTAITPPPPSPHPSSVIVSSVAVSHVPPPPSS